MALRRWRVNKVTPSPQGYLLEVESLDGCAPELKDILITLPQTQELEANLRSHQQIAEGFLFDAKANQRRIVGALRSTIDAHGPISKEWLGSAAKRVESVLRTAYKEQKRLAGPGKAN